MKILISILLIFSIANAQTENELKSAGGYQKSIYIGYLLNSKVGIVGTASTSPQSTTSYEYSLNNSIKIGFEWSQFEKNSWNHGLLIDYTNLSYSEFSNGSTKQPMTESMSIISVGYSGKYRFESFYIPMTAAIENTTAYFKNVDNVFVDTIKPIFLISIGAGYSITNKINLEISSSYHFFNTVVDSHFAPTVTVSPNSNIGYLSNLQLAMKVGF